MSKNKTKQGFIAAVIANLIFGFSFLFSKIALNVTDIFMLLSVRFVTAFIVMNVIVIMGWAKLNFNGKDIKKLLCLGIAQPFLYFVFEQYGIKYTSSAFAGIMIALVPVVAMVLSALFLKESPNKRQYCFAGVSLLGVIFISLSDKGEGIVTGLGIIMLCGAVISAAVFNLLSRYASRKFSAFERTYVMFGLASVLFTAISLVQHRSAFFSEFASAMGDVRFVSAIFYLSIISSILAFLLYNFAVTHIDVTKASSCANLATIVSVLAGVIILKEPLSLLQLICSILIVIGVYGVNMKSKNK